MKVCTTVRTNEHATCNDHLRNQTRPIFPIQHPGDHLAKLGAETALNLVSIFGGARQGKSFLMNLLASAGDDRLFKISNSKDPW